MFLTCPNISSIPSVSHGFFGREGGVSSGIYASLNCGYGSGDDAGNVSENRARVAKALGAEPESLCTAYQIHSPNVAILEKSWQQKDAPQADALATNKSGIALGILTADCLPILFADGKNNVIAAAHAGWKGAFAGVIENTIAAMQSLGAELKEITACIGPAIAQASYEVGAEFYDNFMQQTGENEQFFLNSGKEGHYLFNLPAYAKARLQKAGILQINIVAQDTCFNDNSFFSYRRSCLRGEPAYGRQISAIMLKN